MGKGILFIPTTSALSEKFVPLIGTKAGFPVTGILKSSSSFQVNTINKFDGSSGVAIESVTLKDGDVILSDAKVIKAASGGGYLNLRYGGDNIVELSTDGGAELEGWLYIDAATSGIGFGTSTEAGQNASRVICSANTVNITTETTGGVFGVRIQVIENRIGFFMVNPVIQPVDVLQGAITDNSGGSGTDIPAISGSGADVDINKAHFAIYGLLNEMRTALVDTGLMKGAA